MRFKLSRCLAFWAVCIPQSSLEEVYEVTEYVKLNENNIKECMADPVNLWIGGRPLPTSGLLDSYNPLFEKLTGISWSITYERVQIYISAVQYKNCE